MNVNRATRNGNGTSKVAEQMNILGGKNTARKLAYIKSHDIVGAALGELFRAHNIEVAAAYLRKFPTVPREVATACIHAGKGALLEGLSVA